MLPSQSDLHKLMPSSLRTNPILAPPSPLRMAYAGRRFDTPGSHSMARSPVRTGQASMRNDEPEVGRRPPKRGGTEALRAAGRAFHLAAKTVVGAPLPSTGARYRHKPVKRRGKTKPIKGDGRNGIDFFSRMLEGFRMKYKTRCLAILETKTGKLLATTPEFGMTGDEAVTLATQMKRLTVTHVRLGGVRYRVYVHDPDTRMFGQLNADCYDKIGTNTGFVAIQVAKDHGAIIVGSYVPGIPSSDCELCVRDMARYVHEARLVRVSCERLSGKHTLDCACLVHHMPVDLERSGLGNYRNLKT